MKVLVTGASGLLGRAVFKAFKEGGHDVVGTAFTRSGDGLVQIDLQDEAALEKLIAEVKPEVVVHCAAERRPDVAEKNPDAVTKLNVALPSHLSTLSLTYSFLLIYISTDYVFPGFAPPHPAGYEPGDAVGPTNLYGVTKEAGEREVIKGLEKGGKGTIVRVPVLYGEVETNSESAVNILLDITRRAAKEGGVTMDHWAMRYPTNVADVARVLVDVSVKSLTTPVPPILHFSTQEPFTKHEMCHVLAALHSPPLELTEQQMKPMSDPPKPGETVRPKDCHLVNTELDKLGIDTSGVRFEEWWKGWLEREKAQG
ncbi:dTDP-4-dehydrorhamnose reductase [Pseudohyphozyma bogoriensis]|nr:dTDP-4-dehydrorhamnose reductase [Pseudohyphozyma bogoriensis]